MSESTLRHELPYLAASQAQKHVTHNEALTRIDYLSNLQFVQMNLNAPPNEVSHGDCYFVSDQPSGSFAGQAGMIAAWVDDAWYFSMPFKGLIAYDEENSKLVHFNGSQWNEISNTDGHAFDGESSQSQLGINASADTSNRLTVKSDAVLLSHDDVTPGSGNAAVQINRSADTNSAKIQFATDYTISGEFGLIDSNSFSFKVSSDGSNFLDAIQFDPATAEVSFPNTVASGSANNNVVLTSRSMTNVSFNGSIIHWNGSVCDRGISYSDGVFTLPEDGVYRIEISVLRRANTPPIWIMVGLNNLSPTYQDNLLQIYSGINTYETIGTSMVFEATANSTICSYLESGVIHSNATNSYGQISIEYLGT